MTLLTDKRVAEQLQVKPRTVAKLGIPFVRVGAGKGLKRWRQEDVDAYINLRVQYHQERGNEKEEKKAKRSRVPGGSGPLGLQALPSRAHLQAIRLGHASGGARGAQ
ncbi:MAG: hypothetical protein WD688_07575 [Candidatus Binatia bacterium]